MKRCRCWDSPNYHFKFVQSINIIGKGLATCMLTKQDLFRGMIPWIYISHGHNIEFYPLNYNHTMI